MVLGFPRLCCIPALLILFTLVSVKADALPDRFSWSASGSVFYFAADNGKKGSDPAPILPSLGTSFSYCFWAPLSVELTEDIYFTNYEYNKELGYPAACLPDNRSAFVFSFFTGVQLSAMFPIGKNGIATRVFAGPALDLRIVTLAVDLHPLDTDDAQKQTDAIRAHFWGDGRWFMAVAGAGMDFPANEKFLLGFDMRVWMPVYRLWTDQDIPAINDWRFGLSFRVTPRG
ncbi:MAG: hypothetical protein FWG99_04635 [Treponema sp.]|nr:hypothetical protein [Treponema sp.]